MMTSRSVTHMLISWMLLLFLFEFRGVMEFNTCNFGRENSNSMWIYASILKDILTDTITDITRKVSIEFSR